MADKTEVMRELWPQVLEAAKKQRRFTWILLIHNVKVTSYDGATLILTWVSPGALDNFVNSDSLGVLEEALGKVLNHPASVESVLEEETTALVHPMPESPVKPPHSPVAVTAPVPSLQLDAPVISTLHRVLAQTAFLMHEQGNNRAAALLAKVEDVELAPKSRSEDREAAVLIVPSHLVPRFTDDVNTAIQPVFEHVAERHGLEISGIAAAPALPEIGNDWRQLLQTMLAKGAVPSQTSTTHAKQPSLTTNSQDVVEGRPQKRCTRHGKTTGRRCRRAVAEWPAHDDLPSPVAACTGHLTPEERAACQQARDRSAKENAARWRAELTERETHGAVPKPAADLNSTSQACIGECISQERALGRDSDGATVTCANCDGWVCVSCGQAQVEGMLDLCADCSERESTDDPELEWHSEYEGGTDTEIHPHARLTAMVNELVQATGSTHRQVNARLNRSVGVTTRVGADEQVIRRVASAARSWLDRLSSSS
ncbi:hypothetical protein ABZZ47_30150 [Streptomyces sp. NPDC006465]|uniref:hypothetical protein n=1 Tax=Streptomyces sp. NPDC006465 TaxID=3157174 RepID=UPI0033B6CAE5